MTLEELISGYKPTPQAIEVIRNAKIALLVGISGAGKDTIKRTLLLQPGFREVVSHTTRLPRSNEGIMETEGVEYHFIGKDVAQGMLERGEFVEAKLVHGTVYGTSIREVARASRDGIAVTDIDVQGVTEYKAVSNSVVAIFVVPPSYEIWVDRLKRRYATEAEFAEEWPRRRATAIAELTRALEVPYYHCLINDDLNRAVEAAADIARRPDTFNRKDDEARLVARDLLKQITKGAELQ